MFTVSAKIRLFSVNDNTIYQIYWKCGPRYVHFYAALLFIDIEKNVI